MTADLRAMALGLDPASAALGPTERHPRVFGGVLETGMPNGAFTLVAFADGTTSVYLSTGGGVIGAGEHEAVAAATMAFLDVVERHLDGFAPDESDALPGPGEVVLRALTYAGRLAASVPEDDLGYGRHPLSAVFHAGHDVLTQVRLASGG